MKDSHVYSDRSITSLTLLGRAKGNEPGAWDELVHLYRPLILYWCLPGRQPADAEDFAQEVLYAVGEHLKDFEHNGRPGAFRTWLRTITRHVIANGYRDKGAGPIAIGGSTAHRRLDQVAAPASLQEPTEQELSQELTLLYHRAVELIRNEFSERDHELFRRVCQNGEAPRHVAADLGISANTVSVAVSRIKKRVRDRFGDAIHE